MKLAEILLVDYLNDKKCARRHTQKFLNFQKVPTLSMNVHILIWTTYDIINSSNSPLALGKLLLCMLNIFI